MAAAGHGPRHGRLAPGRVRHRGRAGGDPGRPAAGFAGRTAAIRPVTESQAASLRRSMSRRRVPLLALALALLVAGCGASNPKLLAQSDADKLNATVDSIQQACDSGDTGAVRNRTQQARDEIDGLPRKVDKR